MIPFREQWESLQNREESNIIIIAINYVHKSDKDKTEQCTYRIIPYYQRTQTRVFTFFTFVPPIYIKILNVKY